MIRKKLLAIAFFYLLIVFERTCSVLSLMALICSFFCYIAAFDFRILLFQITAATLFMCAWKAAQTDEIRLDKKIESIRQTLGNTAENIHSERTIKNEQTL